MDEYKRWLFIKKSLPYIMELFEEDTFKRFFFTSKNSLEVHIEEKDKEFIHFLASYISSMINTKNAKYSIFKYKDRDYPSIIIFKNYPKDYKIGDKNIIGKNFNIPDCCIKKYIKEVHGNESTAMGLNIEVLKRFI